MANNYFEFKQFTIWQDKCAMKVGTDGTLLGAWAAGGKHILDIGTGTGLIALMMAQRFPDAMVTGVEIDAMAAKQAMANVDASPFADRVTIVEGDICQYEGQFDCIVSNPPYYEHSMLCPDTGRTKARHTTKLTFTNLFMAARRLLMPSGIFSLIVPFDYVHRIIEEALLAGFFLNAEWSVQTTPRKAPRRFLLSFVLHSSETVSTGTGIIEDAPGQRSEWYKQLTEPFYLR